jgi:hypothetical protein
LVGILASEKGDYAFFDGSNSDYRKVLQPGQSIANYKVLEMTPERVKIQSGTNLVELRVGTQMRRDNDVWRLFENPAAAAERPASASSDASADEESDIVKRMMRQREQELK